MDKARTETSCHELILEAVGLHVIHGAFETEMKAAGWELYRVIINYITVTYDIVLWSHFWYSFFPEKIFRGLWEGDNMH